MIGFSIDLFIFMRGLRPLFLVLLILGLGAQYRIAHWIFNINLRVFNMGLEAHIALPTGFLITLFVATFTCSIFYYRAYRPYLLYTTGPMGPLQWASRPI